MDFRNGHLKAWKTNIPYSQFQGICRNCTSLTEYNNQSAALADKLKEKHYPKNLIQNMPRISINRHYSQEKERRMLLKISKLILQQNTTLTIEKLRQSPEPTGTSFWATTILCNNSNPTLFVLSGEQKQLRTHNHSYLHCSLTNHCSQFQTSEPSWLHHIYTNLQWTCLLWILLC